jgi:hypothetical protein
LSLLDTVFCVVSSSSVTVIAPLVVEDEVVFVDDPLDVQELLKMVYGSEIYNGTKLVQKKTWKIMVRVFLKVKNDKLIEWFETEWIEIC